VKFIISMEFFINDLIVHFGINHLIGNWENLRKFVNIVKQFIV
jgi:hypothetical protein